LLFCGKSWQTKGADIAVETAAALNRLGLPTQLDIVRSQPPDGRVLPSFVRLHGFLGKSVQGELQRLLRLCRDAHFFFLPTRWEPFGHVFTEAAAFGVPSSATQVEGVPSAVHDGVSGKLLPLQAEAGDYADLIFDLLDDAASYRKLGRDIFRRVRVLICLARGRRQAEAAPRVDNRALSASAQSGASTPFRCSRPTRSRRP
jgi:glycosyltransferase involved in cell wall biosynthesis